jgi:hypothetical protein
MRTIRGRRQRLRHCADSAARHSPSLEVDERAGIIDFGRNAEAIGIEVRVETSGDDGSMLDTQIDRLIDLLAADEEQAIVSAAMILLVHLGPTVFARLTAAMWTSEDDRLRIRTIEVLGVCCLSHPEARAILIVSLKVVVEPFALGAIRRALCATGHMLALTNLDPQPEPGRGGRKKPRSAARSRGRKTVTEPILPPPGDAVDS